MGNIFYKKTKEGEHCHSKYYKNGTNMILLCRNPKCKKHSCYDNCCPKRRFVSYAKYSYYGYERYVETCKKDCNCHLNECYAIVMQNEINELSRQNRISRHNRMFGSVDVNTGLDTILVCHMIDSDCDFDCDDD